jgi:hypothetical protein
MGGVPPRTVSKNQPKESPKYLVTRNVLVLPVWLIP